MKTVLAFLSLLVVAYLFVVGTLTVFAFPSGAVLFLLIGFVVVWWIDGRDHK